LSKKTLILCFLLLWCLIAPSSALAELNWGETENGLELVDIAQEIDLSEMNEMLNELDKDAQEVLSGFSLSKIFEDLKEGKFFVTTEDLGKKILKGILKEVVTNGPLVVKLLLLAVLCAIINQLQSAFKGSVSKVAQMLTYLVLVGLALTSFRIALEVGNEAIMRMVSFMQVALPIIYTILIALGNLTSAALFKPIVLGSLVFFVSVIRAVVLPLFFFGIVLRLFNNISEHFKLDKLASLLEFAGKFSIGAVMTIFIGIMTVQGVTGGVTDGVALRTFKYSADLIPIVGKLFKDAVELVVSSGIILKNALGLISLLAIIVIVLAPIIKILAMMFTFKITAALIEPLGEKKLANCLQDMSKGLLYIFVAVASVGIMFFMAVTIIVGAGNVAVMFR
jgi:stage III sporulation protein AE